MEDYVVVVGASAVGCEVFDGFWGVEGVEADLDVAVGCVDCCCGAGLGFRGFCLLGVLGDGDGLLVVDVAGGFVDAEGKGSVGLEGRGGRVTYLVSFVKM